MAVRQIRILLPLTVILCFAPLLGARAEKPLPYSSKHLSYLLNRYFNGSSLESSLPSAEKIDAIRASLQKARKGIFQDFVRHYQSDDGLSLQEAKSKALERKEVWIFDHLIDQRLPALATATQTIAALRLAHELEVIWAATRKEGDPPLFNRTLLEIKALMRSHQAKKDTEANEEASNLVAANGQFLDEANIATVQQSGDLSLYDPDPQSPFWKNPGNISTLNIRDLYYGGKAPLYQQINVTYPESSRARLDNVRLTQSNPKLDVEFRDEQEHWQKSKLKFGAEVHAQPTVSALAVALGFHSDIVKHYKDFRVDLNGKNPNHVKRDWNQYFIPQKPGHADTASVDHYIQSESDDHIVFKETALTLQPPQLMRVGGWSFGDFGQEDLREVRGLHLFNMWIANTDAKQFENNKVVLKPNGAGGYDLFQYQHDIGHSLGAIRSEKLNVIPWQMVSDKSKRSVRFDFETTKAHDVQTELTFADAKWMTRLIAQLTPSQIRDAVALGGWTEAAGELVIAKLIARRNDLVKAFELEGTLIASTGKTITLYPVDEEITMKNGKIIAGNLQFCEDPNNTVDHCNYTADMLAPYGTLLARFFASAGRFITDGAERFDVDGNEFGLDEAITSTVIYDNGRKIMANPNPQSANDLYLVKDSYKIGLRLGAGLILSGEATYWKEYTLVYPTATYDAAVFSRSFFVDLLMPFRVAAGNLPKNFTLIREDYLSGGGRLRAQPTNVGPNMDLKYNKIVLDRAFVIKNNDDDVILYEDSSVSTRLAWRVYLGLLFMKLPLARVENEWGELNGKGYLISRESLSSPDNAEHSAALMLAMNTGDFSEIKKIASNGHLVREVDVKSYFEAPRSIFSLFGFLSSDSTARTDRMQLEIFDHVDQNKTTTEEIQIRLRHKHEKATEGGESHEVIINAFASVTKNEQQQEKAEEPVIELKLEAKDANAESKDDHNEMDEGYAAFVNQLGEPGTELMINQNFKDFSQNGTWGGIELDVDIYFYVNAIENMVDLASDDRAFWDNLATVLKISPQELASYRDDLKTLRQGTRPSQKMPAATRAAIESAQDMISHCQQAVKGRSKGKQFKRSVWKKRNSAAEYHVHELARALYETIYRSKHSFDGTVLTALVRTLGYDNLYIRARLSPSEGHENIFPIGRDYVAEAGVQQTFDKVLYLLNGKPNAAEIYNAFDWLR